MHPSKLSDSWRDKASAVRRYAPEVANALEDCAAELEESWRSWCEEELTVAQAAAESGYSAEHLRRQVRDGKLPAERGNGKKSHIKVRRGDLPRKPGRKNGGANGVDNTYDPEEDARSIAERLGR